MEDKMKIEDFMDKYSKLTSNKEKVDFLESCIVKKYSPILEKRMCLQTLIDKCIIKASTEYFDSFIYRVNYATLPFILYLNVSVLSNPEAKDAAFRVYDFTKTTDFNNVLASVVGFAELNELEIIGNELIKIYENKRKYSSDIFAQITQVLDVLTKSIPENFAETLLSKINENDMK